MGRQIVFGLSYADEERLLRSAQDDGFVAMLRRPIGPDLSRAVRQAIPPDETASPAEYDWAIVPSGLVPVLERAIDGQTRGVPASFVFDFGILLDPLFVPCIEWLRSRRDLRDRPPGGRLYVDPVADHEELQYWLDPVVTEFERLRRLVKAWTVRKGSAYVSKSLM
jgi:hypothetical protein